MQTKQQIAKIDTDLVIEIICGYLKIDESLLFKKDSSLKSVHARYMIFFVLCRIFKMEHADAGKIFDLTHKNVFYGCDKILKEIVMYRDSKQEYNDIRSLIMKRMKDIIIIPTACAIKNKL